MKYIVLSLFFLNVAFIPNLSAQITNPVPTIIDTRGQTLYYKGDFKAETFTAPDKRFQIGLPAHNYKSVREFKPSEIEIAGTGTKYVWSSDDFQLSVKIVCSEYFYDKKQPNAKEDFWLGNKKQVKEYAVNQGGKILAEKDLKTDDYLYKELKIELPENHIVIWRYYFTGTKMFSVNAVLLKEGIKDTVLKYLDSFKIIN